MKGDFSNWYFDPNDNFNGVLEQQGRVHLDSDELADTQITTHWQDTAGKDIIGPGVAAIPADDVNAFKVIAAEVQGNPEQVVLTLLPGRGWADGLLVYLSSKARQDHEAQSDQSITRVATYLTPPIQTPAAVANTLDNGVRDAVVLEVWREAINGFQQPDRLIEPALGDLDTTERLHTAMALRLYRLSPSENCRTIRNALKDNIDNQGKLTVSLQPTEVIASDCPVVAGGGYTGFEHLFYRVEIAQVNSNSPASFKWSQFNGGLVGRGQFDSLTQKVTITANFSAISTSGLDQFYLEALAYDPLSPTAPGLGHWRVIYGTEVTLNNDKELDLSATPRFGTIPSSESPVFFRLWNGIREIDEFLVPAADNDPTELIDGIRLVFETPDAANYRPKDYWTFAVRAGEVGNPEILIDNLPPVGIRYHRVPLAVLNWNDSRSITFDDDEIEDCRDVFNPLTNQRVCCTYTVGDGRSTQGDFDEIEEAIRHLPASGGEICLLPGTHETNAQIENRRNIKIKGCDKKTLVVPRNREAPIFQVIDSECIVLEHMDLVTLGGRAIALRSSTTGSSETDEPESTLLKDITIRHNRFIACEQAIYAQGGNGIAIHHNFIRMLDKADAGVAIYLQADDSQIEKNDLGVIPSPSLPPSDRPDDLDGPPDPLDPCAQLEQVYTNKPFFVAYVAKVWRVFLRFLPSNPFKALGGIQIAGGSERVAITHNTINGGAGNGISLGTSLSGFLDSQDPDSEEEEPPTLSTNATFLSGVVQLNANPIGNITIELRNSDGSQIKTISQASGDLSTPLPAPGTYQVFVRSPGYIAQSVTTRDQGEFGNFYEINIVRTSLDLSDLLAFLYDIAISHNSISNMGLSGIGLPLLSPEQTSIGSQQLSGQTSTYLRLLQTYGNPIVGLNITENHIFECFQNQLDSVLRDLVSVRGLGGISIALCADVSIHRNRIEKNGVTYTKPTCGIWISFGEEVEITHNTIADNAPLSSDPTDDLPAGKRGGIALIASAMSIVNFLQGGKEEEVQVTRRPATRIQDNNVDQPVGRALTLFAIGPAAILNNQFNSERSGPNPLERYVGGVLVLNIGGLNQAGSFINSNIGSSASNPFTTFNAKQKDQFQRDSLFRLPNGNTLFNSNQTRLGLDNQSLISQLIWTADDLGFDGNQSEALAKGAPFDNVRGVINTALLAATLRASDNRFKEPLRSPNTFRQISLLTFSTLMNTTPMNQGSHCMGAFNTAPGLGVIARGNQVIDQTFCPLFNDTQDFED